jgi:anti-anti-sigma factor
METGGFRVEVRGQGRVGLFGELDAASVPALSGALEGVDGDLVELDCSELTFVDSSGLRSMVSAAAGRRVRILAPHPNVLRTMKIAGLDKIDNVEIVPV